MENLLLASPEDITDIKVPCPFLFIHLNPKL